MTLISSMESTVYRRFVLKLTMFHAAPSISPHVLLRVRQVQVQAQSQHHPYISVVTKRVQKRSVQMLWATPQAFRFPVSAMLAGEGACFENTSGKGKQKGDARRASGETNCIPFPTINPGVHVMGEAGGGMGAFSK